MQFSIKTRKENRLFKEKLFRRLIIEIGNTTHANEIESLWNKRNLLAREPFGNCKRKLSDSSRIRSANEIIEVF